MLVDRGLPLGELQVIDLQGHGDLKIIQTTYYKNAQYSSEQDAVQQQVLSTGYTFGSDGSELNQESP